MLSSVTPHDHFKKTAIITGANTGIGFETALTLANQGYFVVMACRNVKKGEEARDKIIKLVPEAEVIVSQLDLTSLKSIENFSETMCSLKTLSLLVNNAGVCNLPYSLTDDNFETVFQTNYLGHFYLTAKLFPLLLADENARIVEVSSQSHSSGTINFDDLQGKEHYSRLHAYPNSKLAGLLFCFELNRRIQASGLPVISVAANPGYTNTDILLRNNKITSLFFRCTNALLANTATEGAQSVLIACTGENVKGGEYYSSTGFLATGKPVLMEASYLAYDEEVAKKLWEESEKMLNIQFRPDVISRNQDVEISLSKNRLRQSAGA
jgi:NAD(P)-dependent dehydrogenase (short-subunit alcohol dehydrogenase family)